jgi:hypothetical protein
MSVATLTASTQVGIHHAMAPFNRPTLTGASRVSLRRRVVKDTGV